MQSQKGVQKQESDNKKHFYLQPLERNMKKTEHKILMMRSSAQKEFYIKTVIYICIYIKKERFLHGKSLADLWPGVIGKTELEMRKERKRRQNREEKGLEGRRRGGVIP